MNPNPENLNFLHKAFVDGGPVMLIILAFGIMTVLLIVERFVSLRSFSISKKEFTDQLFSLLLRGDLRQAIAFCDSRPAPLTNTVKAGLVQVMNKRPDEEVQVAMDASVLRENVRIEGWTSFLAVFGNVAVLAGLLGTIIGMIGSFTAVSAADPATKSELLSKGISHALNCTAFGLLVAILSIVFFGYFQMRISRLENELMEVSMSLLNLVSSNREKFKE